MAKYTIELNWSHDLSNTNGFKIYSSIDGSSFDLIDTIGLSTSYIAQDILPNQNYWFRIIAFNSQGDSDYIESAPIHCDWTVLSPPIPSSAPKGGAMNIRSITQSVKQGTKSTWITP